MRKISLARLLAVATPAAALGGMLAMRSPRAGAEGPYDAAPGLAVPAAPDTGPPACAVLQAHLPHADSMEVSVPHARCGALRLVGAGPARLQRTPDGPYTPAGAGGTRWTWYRENGALMQTGAFDDERKTGVWKRYHPNGALYDEGEYADDRKTGEWKVYDPDGSLLRTTRHRT